MLRLGKIENLYHIAKFSFGLFFVFLKRIRLRSKLISIWFNSILNEITELKITYIITLNMHINLPREAYTRIRGRNRLVAYELFYSPTTDPILPHISWKSIAPCVLRCFTGRYYVLSVKKLSYLILFNISRKWHLCKFGRIWNVVYI